MILHLPLTPATHHLINTERLGKMRSGTLLINVSRGDIVENSALIEALQQGRMPVMASIGTHPKLLVGGRSHDA